ncbi:MAG: hypothetical protein OXF23_06110 [Candidatus Dadabacteria bacterium]|nr:hypothetical protein [Candidatus Dadabacteria bacterium]
MKKKQRIALDAYKHWLGSQEDALRAHTTKASIIFAACSILLGVGARRNIEHWWEFVPEAFFLLSAISCFLAIWPRIFEHGARPKIVREKLLEHKVRPVSEWLLETSQVSLDENSEMLEKSGRYLKAGVLLLGAGMIALAAIRWLSILFPWCG